MRRIAITISLILSFENASATLSTGQDPDIQAFADSQYATLRRRIEFASPELVKILDNSAEDPSINMRELANKIPQKNLEEMAGIIEHAGGAATGIVCLMIYVRVVAGVIDKVSDLYYKRKYPCKESKLGTDAQQFVRDANLMNGRTESTVRSGT